MIRVVIMYGLISVAGLAVSLGAAGTVLAADLGAASTVQVTASDNGWALPNLADARYEATLAGQVVGRGKAVPDTVYLMGGPDRNDGKFQNGSDPDWQGWFGVDLTTRTDTLWNCDTYHCQNLDPETVPNHAFWCGKFFPHDCGAEDFGGYGNSWREHLDWMGSVSDNTAPTTVMVTAVLNYDNEPGYDYLYLEYETAPGMEQQLVFNGAEDSVAVNTSFVVSPADYVGENGDEVHLRWTFVSDGAWSDEDCLWPTMGAAQIDLIEVHFDQGAGPLLQSFENCEGETSEWYVTHQQGVGDFAEVWPVLADIDLCRNNTTPVAAFIDNGVVVPGTGGYLCTTYCYGPGGYVVNPEGGLAGPEFHIQNEIWSPILAWPEGNYEGAYFDFDVWRHLLLNSVSPGIFFVWHVRSVDTGDPDDIDEASWQDTNFLFYGGPDWLRDHVDATPHLVPGRTHVQLALGVYELGWVWGFVGTDATPSPYFDNVSFRVFEFGGPAMSTREIDIAQDNFPAIGAIDFDEPAANSVRFDMAQNIAPVTDLHNDPGDTIICDVVPVRTGSVLNDLPKLYYKLMPNPLFDSVRTLPDEGWVYSRLTYTATGVLIPDRYNFDLPDTGFFFPGDVIHYYLEAQDNVGGDIGTTLMPADTMGFSFSGHVPYSSSFTVRALPSFATLSAGDHPTVLFWNDFGGRGGENEWMYALQNLGYQKGLDFDLYYTNGPSSGVGNGLGGRATATQLMGYETILYTSGDLSAFTISNGDVGVGWGGDAGDDVGVLDTWLRQGSKNLFMTGDDLVFDLVNSGTATNQFVSNWIGVSFFNDDLRPLIDGQSAPTVKSLTGNSVFYACEEWIVYGGCLGFNSFDAVQLAGDTERLAEFMGPDCTVGQYDYAAATLHHDPTYDVDVIYLPYDLMFVYDGGCGGGKSTPAPAAARSCLLEEALLYFGHIGLSPATSVPVTGVFTVKNYPNPFNPSTRIEFNLPRRSEISIKVYNVRGELVHSLLDEVQPAGPGFVVWDGTDDQGATVASGVYFYETTAVGQTRVQKMALLK